MKVFLVLVLLWETTIASIPLYQQSVIPLLRVLKNPEQLYGSVVSADTSLLKISPICLSDLLKYGGQISNSSYAEPWALKMFDASTKIPEGVLMGNLVHLGNYDECLQVTNVPSAAGSFDGQHCLATLAVEENSNTKDITHERSMALPTDIILGGIANTLNGVTMQIALCIPSTCSSEELSIVVDFALNLLNVTNVKTYVDPDQCNSANTAPTLRTIDWIAIGLLVVFILIAVSSTLYDLYCQMIGVKPKEVGISFSLYTNWLNLISVNSASGTMTALNGIRFISMGWVVLGHRYLVVGGLPAVNLVYLNDFKKDWSRLTIMNATVSVDTFFLLSGLLVSYVFLRDVEKRGRFNVFQYYIYRYLRLTPAMAIMILLTITLMNYSGDGPLWDSRNRVYRETCEQNWWTNLLYVNNYVEAADMCLGQTWYLAVDMQLYWLAPLILIPLWKVPRLTQLLIIILLLAGWGIAFTVPFVEKYWAGVYTGPVYLRAISQQKNYYPTHTRYMPWLMGVCLGYWLRYAKKTKMQLSGLQIAMGWILSTVLMVGSIHLAYPFQQPEYVYNRVESAMFLSLFRPAWTLGVAWIIFACDLGYGGLPNMILSWKLFQPLSRLTYAIYLTHVSVIIMQTACIKTPIYLADVYSIPQFMSDLLISIGFSIPLYLLFESPIIILAKILFQRGGNGQKKPPGALTAHPQQSTSNQQQQKGIV